MQPFNPLYFYAGLLTMASLADLQQHLNRFWALPYHENLPLNDKLSEVQASYQIVFRTLIKPCLNNLKIN